MPYKTIGNKVYSKSSGKWRLKQTCRTAGAAQKAIRLLRGIEHGTIKKKK